MYNSLSVSESQAIKAAVSGIKVKLFADDVKLYIQIVNDTLITQLQKAVDVLV